MSKYSVWFNATATQFIEVELEREEDEEDYEFEDRIIDAAHDLLEATPYIRGIDIDQFQWDEEPPELVSE